MLIHTKFLLSLFYTAAKSTGNAQKKRFPNGNLSVGLPGLEPGKAGPESAVLPLHHSPMLKCDAKVQLFSVKKMFWPFFLFKNSKKNQKNEILMLEFCKNIFSRFNAFF